MTQLIQNLSDISDRYNAVLCDLWGCLHNGVTPFPEAVAALQAYRAKGGIVILLTNAPRPKPSVLRILDKMGVPHDAYDDVVTSGDASQQGMLSGLAGNRVYHLGPQKDDGFFTEMPDGLDASQITRVPLKEAEGIVCTGLFDDVTETPDDYKATLIYAKQNGLKLLCTNPDIIVDYGDRRLYCAGAIATLYTEMGGESLYFGKPHPPIYELARKRLNASTQINENRILCIGDGINTDIQGGLGEGFDTLYITGGIAAEEFGPDVNAPDPALLDRFFNAKQMSPTAALPFLR